jgi:hypothetical protein
MIFDGKPTREIASADIAALMSDRVEEDAFLDYKALPYPGGDKGQYERNRPVNLSITTPIPII